MHSQERSGSVALPRTKVVLAMAAALGAPEARRAPRRAGTVRRRVDDMVQLGIVFNLSAGLSIASCRSREPGFRMLIPSEQLGYAGEPNVQTVGTGSVFRRSSGEASATVSSLPHTRQEQRSLIAKRGFLSAAWRLFAVAPSPG